ncbi:MAG: transposase [Candidatus Krumholzibacteriia bacterium]
MLIPLVRKTWSPRGQTPVLRHRYRHDRISAISGISVSPRRRRLGLYCHLYESNISGDEVCTFIRHLLRHLRGHVFALLDNAQIHKGASLRRLCSRFPRLHLEPFPSYAPELNPDEGVWTSLKRSLANSRPDTQADLMSRLSREVRRLAVSPRLLRACIKHSELPPFLP